MTESEIVELIRQVNGTYQNAKPVPPEAFPIWFEDLADLKLEHVRAAFTAYRRAGNAFPPGCAELRRLVMELAEPTPRFEHAWVAIQRAVSRDGSYAEAAAEDALRLIPMTWDLVVAMGGWRCICLGGPDEHKATDPGVWRSQAEHAWRGLVEQQRTDRAVVNIPSALPRIRDAERRLSGCPDPALAPPTPIAEVTRALPAGGPSTPAPAPAIKPNGLKPEYRAELVRLIREGQEAQVPERWRVYVAEVKAELEARS